MHLTVIHLALCTWLNKARTSITINRPHQLFLGGPQTDALMYLQYIITSPQKCLVAFMLRVIKHKFMQDVISSMLHWVMLLLHTLQDLVQLRPHEKQLHIKYNSRTYLHMSTIMFQTNSLCLKVFHFMSNLLTRHFLQIVAIILFLKKAPLLWIHKLQRHTVARILKSTER